MLDTDNWDGFARGPDKRRLYPHRHDVYLDRYSADVCDSPISRLLRNACLGIWATRCTIKLPTLRFRPSVITLAVPPSE
jgi:hypothetical protein